MSSRYLQPPASYYQGEGSAPPPPPSPVTRDYSGVPAAPSGYYNSRPPVPSSYDRHGGGERYGDHPDRYDRYGGGDRRDHYDRYGGGGGERPDRYDRYGGPRGDRYPPRRGFDDGSNMPLRDSTNTVWVGSLDTAIHTDEALYNAFGLYGRVMRIAKHPDRGYCFVHFRRIDEARTAVEELTKNRLLGPAVFNYGKMFEYTEEEMNMPYDPSQRGPPPPPPARPPREERGDREYELDRPPVRRARPERDPIEPTNVLWVGSLPHYITDDKLREVFEVFGPITTISRMERSNIAFVHFDTEEHCTMALTSMSGRLIENGVVLALNYGAPQRPRAPREVGDVAVDGIPSHEVPTNVVYLGQLPSNITDEDVDRLFAPYAGFISAKYVPSANIGFGHFDTIDNARAARVGLNNATMMGVGIRVNFGKNNHSMTMADRGNGAENQELSLDAMMRAPDGMNNAGALVLTNSGMPSGMSLVLPAMGVSGSALTSTSSVNHFEKDRVAPAVTLDIRLQSVLGSTYNGCGDKGLELSPSQVLAICSMVDRCVDARTTQQLDATLVLYCPLKAVHVFNVIAKRIHDYFNNDPHKKLLVLYAVTRVVLGAVTEYIPYSEAALNAFLSVLLVSSTNLSSSGMDRLTSMVESLQRHPFLDLKTKTQDSYKESFREQLEEVMNHAKAEQDVAALLVKKRRRRD